MYTEDLTKVKNLVNEMKARMPTGMPEIWYEKVEKAHQDLRKQIGGISKRYDLSVSVNVEETGISPLHFQATAIEIAKIIPQYFTEYRFDHNIFRFPIIKNGKFRGMTISKHISHWMKREKIDEVVQKIIINLIGKVNKYWKAVGKVNHSGTIEIDTSALAFASLGQTAGLDTNSCFAFGGMNHVHKLIIGQTHNTFVGYGVDTIGTRYARFWGIIDPNRKWMSISNFYGTQKDKLFALSTSLVKNILGTDNIYPNGTIKIKGVWQNGDSRIFSTEDLVGEELIVQFDDSDLSSMRKCGKCLKYTDDLIVSNNGYYYCPTCAESILKTCEHCHEKTINYYSTRQYESGEHGTICHECADKYYTKSSYSAYYFIKDKVILDYVGRYIEIPRLDVEKLRICNDCKRAIPISNIACSFCALLEIKKRELVAA